MFIYILMSKKKKKFINKWSLTIKGKKKEKNNYKLDLL